MRFATESNQSLLPEVHVKRLRRNGFDALLLRILPIGSSRTYVFGVFA
jgi:hypothetical protein